MTKETLNFIFVTYSFSCKIKKQDNNYEYLFFEINMLNRAHIYGYYNYPSPRAKCEGYGESVSVLPQF